MVPFTHCSNTPKGARSIFSMIGGWKGSHLKLYLGTLPPSPDATHGKHNTQSFCHFCTFRRGSGESTVGRTAQQSAMYPSFLPSRRQIDEFRRVSAQARSDAPFKRPRSGERYRELEDGKGRDVLWSNNRKGHRRLVACGNEGRKRITTSCRRTLPRSLKIAARVTMI